MKELYIAIAILCFLVAIMIYCVNKTIQCIKNLNTIWKSYKNAHDDIENSIKEFYRKK